MLTFFFAFINGQHDLLCVTYVPEESYMSSFAHSIEVSPCLDPGYSHQPNTKSKYSLGEGSEPLGKYINKTLTLPINTFCGIEQWLYDLNSWYNSLSHETNWNLIPLRGFWCFLCVHFLFLSLLLPKIHVTSRGHDFLLNYEQICCS